jgi:surface antigen
MRAPLSLSAALLCAACATQPYPSTASISTAQLVDQNPSESSQSPPESNCREFTAPVTIGGQQQQAIGQACQQPDGSWQITQDTPGLAPQIYTLPPQPFDAYPYPYAYDWADPWAFGSPFFVGGSIFFEDRFHHFHDHDGFRHEPFHGGFHGGGFHGGGFHGGGFHGGGFHGGGGHR